jgi:hypothetical protein
MEGEKIKEIKKVLEICTIQDKCCECPNYFKKGCIANLHKDTLTYINELKSENERLCKELNNEWKDRRKADEDLHKAQWKYKIGLAQSRKRNKELKDRIAELKNEIAKSIKEKYEKNSSR